MNKPNVLTALAAVLAVAVTSDEEAVTELQKAQPEIVRAREFSATIANELGETDPGKALTKIKELKAAVATHKDAAVAARKAEIKGIVETTMTKFEKRMTLPLKTQLAARLTQELEAGTELEKTETFKAIDSMPELGALGRSSGTDTGKAGGTDGEKLVARTRELMASDAEIKELHKTSGFSPAWKEAGRRAEKELGFGAK